VPIYEYACTDCAEELEVRQSFTDEALTVCPACGGRLRKVLSPVGVVFKGSGFYRNDSRAAASNGDGDRAASSSEKQSAEKSSEKGSSGKGSEKQGAPERAGSGAAGTGGSSARSNGSSKDSGSKPAPASAR
jgi:putative FmdB family regulatory protein